MGLSSFLSSSPMDLNTRKEEFSYAYISAIAAQAGFSVEPKGRSMDAAGIDITIVTPGSLPQSIVSYPRIDDQVKCTSSKATVKLGDITFPLEIKNYEKLRQNNPLVPQLLIVLIVPKIAENWVEVVEPDKLVLQNCAYWLSLVGKAASSNKDTVTVHIPRSNVLTAEALVNLMGKVANRQSL